MRASRKTAAMGLEQIMHMNGGEGEQSYANNSAQQKEAILKATPLIEQSLNDLYSNGGFPECIRSVDIGCSSGPNSLLPTRSAFDALHRICDRLHHKPPPAMHAFLNDMPGNDFNTTFKSFPSFYQKLRAENGNESGSCFVAAAPGSFYGRLFPPNFLHLVYSFSALHWLSQAPTRISNKAHSDQFSDGFSSFLKFRSEELKSEGRMVFTFMVNYENHCTPYEAGEMVLQDMVSEGLIEESKLRSFSLPLYSPYVEEVEQVIRNEGSFEVHHLETFPLSWLAGFDDGGNKTLLGFDDRYEKGRYVAKHIRVEESVMACHFGEATMDEFYHRLAIKVTDEFLEKGRPTNYTIILIYLVKK